MNVKSILILAVLTMLVIAIGWLYWGPPNPPKKCIEVFFERHGDLIGCNKESFSSDISADGLKVVGSSSADENNTIYDKDCIGMTHEIEASGWTRKCQYGQPYYPGKPKGIIGLGYLLPSTSQSSAANGISPDGLVAVGFSDTAYNAYHPVVFLPSGIRGLVQGASGLGYAIDVSPTNANVAATDNNWDNNPLMNRRVVVGWHGPHHPRRTAGAGARAVFWNSFTHIVELTHPVLSNGRQVVSSEAVCISNDGETIGGNVYYNMQAEGTIFRSYPCVWKWNGTIYSPIALKDLAGGDTNARITHISGDGNVLVGWGNTIAGDSACYGYPKRACKWVYTGGSTGNNSWSPPIMLLQLTGSYDNSYAAGTNFYGTVIVGSAFTYGICPNEVWQSTATVWDLSNVSDLNTTFSNMLGGYHLYGANRVSDNGGIITGLSYPAGTGGEGWTIGRH